MADGTSHISILGGGPAGLSAAHHASQAGLPFDLYEAGPSVGGNCRTLDLAGHRFDTGAHRLHGELPHVVEEIRSLLGGDLLTVDAPSQISVGGRLVDFPLSPLDVLRTMDRRTLAGAVRDKLASVARDALSSFARGASRDAPGSFEELAVARYGRTLAELLLLNYSEKLWGAPADRLSPAVAGRRLNGLDLKTFLLETFFGRISKTRHLDGRFYYPRNGYGAIMDALADSAGRDRIHCAARVTALRHDGSRIRSVAVNGEVEHDVEDVVSTLPLPLAVRILQPSAPAEIVRAADGLHFRHLRLVILALNRPSFSPNASLYFPDADLPFTRIYEPKNRSPYLSPPDETAIVIELPCSNTDALWNRADAELVEDVRAALADRGLLGPNDVTSWRTLRIAHAYPILEVGFEERAERIADYLESFSNLSLVGRSARFEYSHVHRIFASARQVIHTRAECTPSEKSFVRAA